MTAEDYKAGWREGTIGIPTDEGTRIAHYWAKVYDTGSEFGINGGRISKLEIRIDGKRVLNYDRGWDLEPDENDEATMLAYSIILKEHN